jgi:hypothetical protein
VVKHYTLTLTGAVQRLNTVLVDPAVGGPSDLPCRLISFQHGSTSQAAAIYVGDRNVSATDWGIRVDVNGAPIQVGSFDMGPYKLSEFYVIGTAEQVLHILTVPY